MHFVFILLTLFVHADSLAPSAAKSLGFQEEAPKAPSRGPASVPAAPPVVVDIPDHATEADFCLYCGTSGAMRTESIHSNAQEILQHAQEAAKRK